MIIYAPAKVNLYLRVLGLRPDGYHNIETLFERIGLCDRIVLRPLKRNKIRISCDNTDIPTDKRSLIYKTINAVEKSRRVPQGVKVEIYKKIPIAAGLGGGSSDAASVLIGLNKLWKLGLNRHELVEIGKKLGADVPFFLADCSFANGRKRGDVIKPLRSKRKYWHLLITPPVKLLSKDVYGKIGTEPYFPILSVKKIGLCPYFPHFSNDLEKVILKKAPIVARLKEALGDIGFVHSLVSGSGPSVFTLFEKRKEAVGAKGLLVKRFPVVRDKGWQIFIVPTL